MAAVNRWFSPHFSSLSRQLLSRCAIVLLIGTAVAESLAYYYVREGLEKEVTTRANSITQALEFSTESLLDEQESSNLQRVLQNYATLPAVIEVAILDPSHQTLAYGSLLFPTQSLAWAKQSEHIQVLNNASIQGVPATLRLTIEGKDALVQILPFSSTLFPKVSRRGLAIAVIDVEQINQDLIRRWLFSTLIMTIGSLLVLCLIAWLIHQLVHQPISAVNKSVIESQQSGSFEVPTGLPQNEVLFLAETFNRVFQAEQDAYKQLEVTNQELARATRLKDEFLANMSHELRTPLNAILGLSEACIDEIYGPLNPKMLKSLKTIQQSGEHLLELINDILDLAKIQSDVGSLQISLTPATHLCNAGLSLVQQLAAQKQVTLQSDIPDNLGSLYVDERRMRQVLINLLGNAVKFTPPGGSVLLKAQFTADSNHLQIQVQDTGIGIAPENLDHIFEAFVQVDGRFNRQYQGTGLGLALVKQITALHHGSVSVTSQLGKGSCFTVTLPYPGDAALVDTRLPEPLPQAPWESTEEYPGNNGNGTTEDQSPCPELESAALYQDRIPGQNQTLSPPLLLIVEDNWTNLNTFSEYLTAKGYRLLIARNGEDALLLTQVHKPDLILMDIQMPGISGLEVIQRLRAMSDFTHLPIIALTALAAPSDRDRCLAAGATGYLAKPLKLRLLLETVQQTLASV